MVPGSVQQGRSFLYLFLRKSMARFIGRPKYGWLSCASQLIALLGMVVNLLWVHSGVMGWVWLVLWLGVNAHRTANVLNGVFGWYENWGGVWLATIMTIMLGSSILGITLTLFGLTAVSGVWSLMATSLILEMVGFFSWRYLGGSSEMSVGVRVDSQVESAKEKKQRFLIAVLTLVYAGLVAVGLYLLRNSHSVLRLSSPWQVIHPTFIYVFFGTVLLSGCLITKVKRAQRGVLVVIVQTFFLHCYLALTHSFFYGADGWRYIANETRFLYEQSFLSSTLSQAANAFDWGRLSYASLWGLSTFLVRLTGVDFISLHKWLMPVLWSVFVPVMVFEIARKLGLSNKKALFLTWLGLLPFAWQAGGVFTIANNFSFVWFLLLVLLLISWWQERMKSQLILLIFFGLISIFQYGLYFILFWFLFAGGEMIRMVTGEKISTKIRCSLLVIMTVLSIGFIPITEIILKYAMWPTLHLQIFVQLKVAIKNFTGWFLAVGPIDQSIGNIIFNQVPPHAFVANLFTLHRSWIVVSMVLLWLLVMVGLVQSMCSQKKERITLSIGFVGLLGGYSISRFFLIGEKVLSRRLENVLAFFIILFLVLGLGYFYEKFSDARKKYVLIAGVVAFSVMIIASYSLGPDEQVVSKDEYGGIAYVWQNMDKSSKPCVIADTFPLLVLESLSQKQVVGGGFPIDAYFSQPERVAIFTDMQRSINQAKWQTALNITQAKECWLVSLSKDVTESKAVFGKVGVWQYNEK